MRVVQQHPRPPRGPQQPPPRKRADRSTTSCGECRRRKQKCNQGQPCSNCMRRFPEPICDYGSRKPDSSVPTFLASVDDHGPAGATTRRHQGRPTRPRGALESDVVGSGPRNNDNAGWSSHDTVATGASRFPTPGQPWEGSLYRPAGSHKNGRWKTKTPSRHAAAFGLDGIVYQCQLSGPAQIIGQLPMAATKQNAMLISTFPELLFRFKGSLDGEPDKDNPFITEYVPWCLQSPLLARTSLYISARSLAERGFIDPRSTMRVKGEAIAALNEHLGSERWISEEVMGGVVQFIAIEWFFGEPEVVQAHLKGLREIVKLRGGFPLVGVGSLVTKAALVDDRVIALSLETMPLMERSPDFDFDYRERPSQHLKVRHNSPLVDLPVSFASCEEALQLHPATALILDEIAFLIKLALTPPQHEQDSAEKVRKTRSTARWILDRICGFDALSTEGQPWDSRNARREGTSEPRRPPSTASVAGESTDIPHGSHQRPVINLAATDARPYSFLPDYPSYTASSRGTTASAETETDRSSVAASPAATGITSVDTPPRGTPQPTTVVAGMQTGKVESHATARSGSSDGDEGIPRVGTVERHHQPPEDPLHLGVRQAATLYARAIAQRQAFSAVCSPSEALALLSTTWRIPLGRWRGTIGVFLFMVIAIMPTMSRIQFPRRRTAQGEKSRRDTDAGGRGDDGGEAVEEDNPAWNDPKEVIAAAHLRPHCGFVKSILQIGFTQLAIEDWNLCAETMERGLALQRWLRGGREGGWSGGREEGGEGASES